MRVLADQFPHIGGFQNTCLGYQLSFTPANVGVQILHTGMILVILMLQIYVHDVVTICDWVCDNIPLVEILGYETSVQLYSTVFALYGGEVRFIIAHTLTELRAARRGHPGN